MSNQIALGFQNTVDFELAWDPEILKGLVEHYGIRNQDIRGDIEIRSERDILCVLLNHMKEGTGTERSVCSSEVTRAFASHFPYQVTLGGTAVRAAIAMSQIGIPSTIHACSLNHHFRRLIPDNVAWMASVPDEGENYHPHVIAQYPLHARIQLNDIDITTCRPNRVIFAHDPPSTLLQIDPGFSAMIPDAKVFLAASYNTMKDQALLSARLAATIHMIRSLSPDCVTVMEDACFESPEMRRIVTETLRPHLRIFSMNEDELQDRAGFRFDILDPNAVAAALKTVYHQVGVPILICHSAYWALAYGKNPDTVRAALTGGITMASTRFRMGDNFCRADYEKTRSMKDRSSGLRFAHQLTELVGSQSLLCLPGKDLDTVAHPTTIGLGDAFIGGMLPMLLP